MTYSYAGKALNLKIKRLVIFLLIFKTGDLQISTKKYIILSLANRSCLRYIATL